MADLVGGDGDQIERAAVLEGLTGVEEDVSGDREVVHRWGHKDLGQGGAVEVVAADADVSKVGSTLLVIARPFRGPVIRDDGEVDVGLGPELSGLENQVFQVCVDPNALLNFEIRLLLCPLALVPSGMKLMVISWGEGQASPDTEDRTRRSSNSRDGRRRRLFERLPRGSRLSLPPIDAIVGMSRDLFLKPVADGLKQMGLTRRAGQWGSAVRSLGTVNPGCCKCPVVDRKREPSIPNARLSESAILTSR